MPLHAERRRGTRQPFCGRRRFRCCQIVHHQCTRSQGRICFLFTSRKYQNLTANRIEWLPQLWLHWFVCHQHKKRWTPSSNLFSFGGTRQRPNERPDVALLKGYDRVDPLMVGVWPRNLKARDTIAYFQYSDAKGQRWETAANPGACPSFANASKSAVARSSGQPVRLNISHIDVTITTIVALTTKPPPYGAR
jgi:hypothetical protein